MKHFVWPSSKSNRKPIWAAEPGYPEHLIELRVYVCVFSNIVIILLSILFLFFLGQVRPKSITHTHTQYEYSTWEMGQIYIMYFFCLQFFFLSSSGYENVRNIRDTMWNVYYDFIHGMHGIYYQMSNVV